MGNLFRGLATGLLAVSVLVITGCETRPLQVIIPDFDIAAVEGVEIWHVDAAGQVTPAATLAFTDIVVLDTNGTQTELLAYQMIYPDGVATQPFHTELVRDAQDPEAVHLLLLFDLQAKAGWYRVSTYNSAGSSPLSADQKYLM